MAEQTIVKAYRGPASGLPTLEAGQLGFTTDTHAVWIGDGATNHAVLMAPVNLFADGDFEAGIAGWDGAGSTLSWEKGAPLVGLGSLKMTTAVGSAEAYYPLTTVVGHRYLLCGLLESTAAAGRKALAGYDSETSGANVAGVHVDCSVLPRLVSVTFTAYETPALVYFMLDAQVVGESFKLDSVFCYDLSVNGTDPSWLTLGPMASATAKDYVEKSLFHPYTILAATSEETPISLTVDAQTLVGRITGGIIAALSIAQIRTLLGISAAGAALIDDAAAADQRTTLGGVVVGAASANDNALVRFNDVTGKVIQGSGDMSTSIFLTDTGNLGLHVWNPTHVLQIYQGDFSMGMDGEGGSVMSQFASSPDVGFKFDSPGISGLWYGVHDFYTGYNGAASVLAMRIKNGAVAIGVANPNANAVLDVVSTTKAFMPPRMTTTQRDAIATPTEGMLIFNTTTHVLNYYGASAWAAV